MLALFAFGTIWFWIISAILLISVIIAVESDSGAVSFVFSLVLAGYLVSIGHGHLFKSIIHHPGRTLAYVLGYILIGVVWAVFKWYLHLRKSRQSIMEYLEKYADNQSFKSYNDFKDRATAIQKADLADKLKWRSEYNPKVSSHKSSIMFWMSYWPFSFLGAILTDFVRNLYNHIYIQIAGFLQRMSDKMFADIQ